MKPDQYNKSLDDLVMFLAQVCKIGAAYFTFMWDCSMQFWCNVSQQVAHCFPEDLVQYPQDLTDILQKHPTTLHPDIRKVISY